VVDIRAGLRAGVMLILLFGAGTVRAWPLPPPASPPLSAPKIVTLSEWNGEIDPARMQTADVSAAIVRASYGTERDSRVLENVATLRAAGIPVAALYHEFDPAADWPAQLDTFTEIMRQAGVERGALRLPPPMRGASWTGWPIHSRCRRITVIWFSRTGPRGRQWVSRRGVGVMSCG